jgi:hypothetical protein
MLRVHATRIAAAVVAGFSLAGTAHAGPVEQLVEVAMQPGDPDVMAVRYQNGGGGLFITRNGGRTWQLQCGSAMFGTMRTSGGPFVITGDGVITMGVFSGLLEDDAHGCGFRSEPAYDGLWVSSLAVDPNDSAVAYGVTSSGGKLNGMVRRDSGGAWSDLGTREDLLIADVHVVPHGTGVRFYENVRKTASSGPDGGTSGPIDVIRVSDDGGTTWREHPYGATDGTLHIEAIDPTNPDRLVIAIERAEDGLLSPNLTKDSVLVSSDEGTTFTDYLAVTEIGGVAFAPDGRLWIGDSGDPFDSTLPGGLWSAPSLDASPSPLPEANYPVQCLGYQSATGTVYACQKWKFGAVDAASGAFRPVLDVTKVASFVDCAGVDTAAVCETQLCGAYCGAGHFAQAPVCCAYDTAACGPKAAEPGTASCGSTTGSSPDAGVADAGAPSDASTHAGSVPDASGDAGNAAPVTHVPTANGRSHSSGGCSVALGRDVPRGRRTLALFAAAFMARRARRRARHALTARRRCGSSPR